MRLAGSVNGKTGAHARIVEADFALAPYPIAQLVGDLPDSGELPAHPATAARRDRAPTRTSGSARREYFEKLAGIVVPRDGLVSCPAPEHEDRNPSCSVGTSPETGVVLPLRELRGAGRDLRPRVGAARRAVGTRAARRGVQPRPRIRRRRVRRAGRNQRRDGRSAGPVKGGARDESEGRKAGGYGRARRRHRRSPRGSHGRRRRSDRALRASASSCCASARRPKPRSRRSTSP